MPAFLADLAYLTSDCFQMVIVQGFEVLIDEALGCYVFVFRICELHIRVDSVEDAVIVIVNVPSVHSQLLDCAPAGFRQSLIPATQACDRPNRLQSRSSFQVLNLLGWQHQQAQRLQPTRIRKTPSSQTPRNANAWKLDGKCKAPRATDLCRAGRLAWEAFLHDKAITMSNSNVR